MLASGQGRHPSLARGLEHPRQRDSLGSNQTPQSEVLPSPPSSTINSRTWTPVRLTSTGIS
jgi:hypothetical protein